MRRIDSTRRQGATRLVVAALVCGAAIAGCGAGSATLDRDKAGSATLDKAKVERAIAESILEQSHIYSRVSCPDAIPVHKGRRFTCDAHMTVGVYPVYVTETNREGAVSYANRAGLTALDVTRVERSIEKSMLAQRNLHTRVTCPGEVLQQRGLDFTCTAHVGAKSYQFAVTETNGQGHVRYVER